MKTKNSTLTLGLLLLLALAACTGTPTPEATPTDTVPPATVTPEPTVTATMESSPGRVVFSELVPGIPGNNNFEFIELYNAGMEAVNLEGWSLWYKMTDDQDEKRVATWTARTDVPGYGHYLLVRAGEDAGVSPDKTFETPLFERKGGLVLKDAGGEVVDALGWGDAPAAFVLDAPAPAPTEGDSIERNPGGEAGNGTDSNDSAADFFIQTMPNPQNRGHAITPLPEKRLEIAMTAPVSITPGTEFDAEIRTTNRTGQAADSVTVVVPVPQGFAVIATPPEASGDEALIEIPLAAPLDDGASQAWTLTLRSPWNYDNVYVGGIYVEAQNWPMRAYTPLTPISIEGGAVPIGAARTLTGSVVTVEGVATMYTGGFYAGSTGTKFYVEDESGGVQVYCPGAADIVSVRIGDRVRVTGRIEVYRDSLELIPIMYPDDVRLLEKVEPLAAQTVSGEAATSDDSLRGRLTTVEGTLTRLEEFSYSYEADLLDEQGDSVYVYIDKETRINPEFLEVGKKYRITGISEFYNTQWELMPRASADFVQVFPPELMLEVMAQNSVMPGDVITYSLTAYNHTPDILTGVHITAEAPLAGATVAEVLDGGTLEEGALAWELPKLAGEGGSAVVRFTAAVSERATEPVELPAAGATADGWPEPAMSASWRTFIGSGVPIWAIQGNGNASPFVRSTATAEGLVTGVFPKQSGFWIQSPEPDDDPATSEGLFVLVSSEVVSVPVVLGDRVRVTGKVREVSGQTLLYLEAGTNLSVVDNDNALPEPIELDPPVDGAESRAYYEALEGMLVAVSEPALVVAPTTKYGETALVRPSWEISRVMKDEPQGMVIFADDGSDETHLDRSTMPYAAKSGDFIGDLRGPLAFTYENYKIQPIITPTVITAEVAPPTLTPVGEGAFSIATFNAENFFDFVEPHPSSPARPTPSEYRTRVAKVANTIVAMGTPAIVGLQEIENIMVLEDLAADEALVEYGYVPVLIEGLDSRGIDVGYLVRGDVTLEGASQHPAPEGLTSRPPLLITATVHPANGDQTVYVINNHFTSMSGGEASTEAQRTAQAEWNVTLAQRLLAEHPGAFVVVLGDLNSFYRSRPMDALRDGGLHHVYEFLEPDVAARVPAYTYIYQGESETLDHIWVSPALLEHIAQVEVLHVNSDYPPPLPDDTSPEHTSDHDPLVVVFAVK